MSNILQARRISGWTSVFLDSLRLIASIIVLLVHGFEQWFPQNILPTGKAAHTAVVVFFVLSGYVIAYTTSSNKSTARQYAIARLSRLYSVLLPALFITGIIEVTVMGLAPSLHEHYSRGPSVPRYFLASLFFNEIWFLSAAPRINGPLWSLSFEFWYYVIFGLWFYQRKLSKPAVWIFLACFLAGPKILLLMPVWLLGNFAYHLSKCNRKSNWAWFTVIICLIIAGFSGVILPSIPYRIGISPFVFANQFITDIITGMFVAAAFYCLPYNRDELLKSNWIKQVRSAADMTYPIYVLHFPLLVLWRAVFGYHINNAYEMWTAIVTVLITAILLGLIFEQQRHHWTDLFKWLLVKLNDAKINIHGKY